MALKVACLTHGVLSKYRKIARWMAEGIRANGDVPIVAGSDVPPKADVGIMWGWKYNAILRRYPKFVYFDLGYFKRDEYYRASVGGWSPILTHGGPERFASLGLEIQPWHVGDTIVIAGSTMKACVDHGLGYMQWEQSAAHKLKGLKVTYRPKPNDQMKRPIPGIGYDTGPLSETLKTARAVVAHHSNVALDALLAGVPVYAEAGPASHFSVPMDQLADPPLLEGREQFFSDLAWLQWTPQEMMSGACWAHLRKQL
jgi:hypothetical protein